MIDRSVLESLVPEMAPPLSDVRRAASWLQLDDDDDPFALHVERWCLEIQLALGGYLDSILPDEHFRHFASDLSHLIGVGFFDVPPALDLRLQTQRIGFGVVLYSFAPEADPDQFPPIQVGEALFPVVRCSGDFVPHGALSNGRCAAIVESGGNEHFLTARHCVETLPQNAPVDVTCRQCGAVETTVLSKRGHVYLDVALLQRGASPCSCRHPRVRQTAYGLRGASVHLHDGPPASGRAATVMNGIAKPTAMINGARPQTFTLSVHGQKGDSGAAISSDRFRRLVGLYCGALDVGTGPGHLIRRGYGQCADEALRLFQCNVREGLF